MRQSQLLVGELLNLELRYPHETGSRHRTEPDSRLASSGGVCPNGFFRRGPHLLLLQPLVLRFAIHTELAALTRRTCFCQGVT